MTPVANINDFKKALEFVLKHEGGYVNDKDDPGGETKWGISKRSYPHLDIATMSPETAAEIYLQDFWIPLGCEAMSFPNNVAVFDSGVNCGKQRAKKWMKESTSIFEFLNRRRLHYLTLIKNNPSLKKFERGWMNRLNDLEKFVELNQSFNNY